jgi:hypothetical protein
MTISYWLSERSVRALQVLTGCYLALVLWNLLAATLGS